jgi:sigma-B regulation protein RsbU (phosphoserine phosphatase)
MLRPKTLQQRLVFYLLAPVALLLLGIGLAGFFYARTMLLEQWSEASILKLQRAAHQVDMRLGHFKDWLQMYRDAVEHGNPEFVGSWVLDRLKALDGVTQVRLIRADERNPGSPPTNEGQENIPGHRHDHGMGGPGGGHQMHARAIDVTPPRFDDVLAHETVSLISDLIDDNRQDLGRLEMVIRFDYLVEGVVSTGWWQSNKAFLVDQKGSILTCTLSREACSIGETDDPLEVATLKALQQQPAGTIIGSGRPPTEVSGFFRLQEAPWSLVVIAPGRDILGPIIRFRTYYFIIGSGLIVVVLLLIRWVTGRTAAAIREVASAAQEVARGHYDTVLASKRDDEVGQLVNSFNRMVEQLEEGMHVRQSLELAMEVQQSLLPTIPPHVSGLDIAGRSLYCDETGGDYYDFLHFTEWGPGRVVVAVGDVAGHGISAALLMTTARALLRARIAQPGTLAQVMTDANRLLCMDTAQSGNFMTLFLLLLDAGQRQSLWVRAGHDPAIVYDPVADTFDDWVGAGMAMGIDETQSFQENRFSAWSPGLIILLGTDGIWETENADGEMFGKERVRDVIRRRRDGSSEEILQAIIDAIGSFRQAAPQRDDVTLVVVKIKE